MPINLYLIIYEENLTVLPKNPISINHLYWYLTKRGNDIKKTFIQLIYANNSYQNS